MEFQTLVQYHLLSINPKNARYYNFGNYMQFGVLGALLYDLYLGKVVSVENKRVALNNTDEVFPVFLERPVQQLRNKSNVRVQTLLNRMSFRQYSIRKSILKYLAEKEEIKLVQKQFLGIRYMRYVPFDSEKHQQLIRSLRDVLLRGETPQAEDYPILYLIKTTNLLRALSDVRNERVAMRRRLRLVIKEISTDQQYAAYTEINKGIRYAIMSANAAKS